MIKYYNALEYLNDVAVKKCVIKMYGRWIIGKNSKIIADRGHKVLKKIQNRMLKPYWQNHFNNKEEVVK